MARSQELRPITPCSWCKHPQYAHMNVTDCRAHDCDCEEFVFPYFDSSDDETRSPAQKECTHHWVLSQPTGESMTGVCRRCGTRQEFPVSPPKRFNNRLGRTDRG